MEFFSLSFSIAASTFITFAFTILFAQYIETTVFVSHFYNVLFFFHERDSFSLYFPHFTLDMNVVRSEC